MIKKTSRSPDDEDKKGISLSMQLSIGLIALVLIAGAAAGINMFRKDDSADSGNTPSTTTSAPSNSNAQGFTTPDVDVFGRRIDVPNNEFGQALPQTDAQRRSDDPDWLTAAPSGTQGAGGWQRVTGAVVPFSTSDGPTSIVDGVPVGWAHTPQGCALAAAWVTWEVNARPGDRRIRERAVVSTTADLAQFDRDRAAGKLPDRMPQAAAKWMLASDAFKIISFRSDLCTLSLATRTEPGKSNAARWLSSTVAMAWVDGSWRLRPPPGGNPPQENVTSLAGWTTW